MFAFVLAFLPLHRFPFFYGGSIRGKEVFIGIYAEAEGSKSQNCEIGICHLVVIAY